MKKKLCYFIYCTLLGWKADVRITLPQKCIVCTAPHTSNWDLFYGKLFINAIGENCGFMMKKFWFFWPLGYLFRWMGGIPVNRTKRTSMVDSIIAVAKNCDHFRLAITPEGTRKANPTWKKGFYYIAQGAQIPIILIGIDYQKKCITAEKEFVPTGDVVADMHAIQQYFTQFTGKKPQNFTIES